MTYPRHKCLDHGLLEQKTKLYFYNHKAYNHKSSDGAIFDKSILTHTFHQSPPQQQHHLTEGDFQQQRIPWCSDNMEMKTDK